MDLHSRQRSLELATHATAREAEQSSSRSLLARWTASSPAAKHQAGLQVEVAALSSLEAQMARDVVGIRRRKEMAEMGRTARGRLWLFLGWLLSVYCMWRVFIVSWLGWVLAARSWRLTGLLFLLARSPA